MTYFAEIGVEISYAGAQFLHVLCEKVVGICYAVVQVAHLVVCEASGHIRHGITIFGNDHFMPVIIINNNLFINHHIFIIYFCPEAHKMNHIYKT